MQPPICLAPANPHYFRFGGRTLVLVGSSEHYGAVLNTAFDYRRYLHATASAGLNMVRAFGGVYRESPGSFGIVGNTLAPEAHAYLAPWVRLSDNRWDLARISPEFMDRLDDFISVAASHGIVVELTFFCPFYEESLWLACPLHPTRNASGVGRDPAGRAWPRGRAFTLENPGLLEVQEHLVETIVRALNRHGNLFYEVINEPYWACDDVAERAAWHARMVDTIRRVERDLPNTHLVAQNIQNGAALVPTPPPGIDVLNFHYARPAAVLGNWHLGLPIGDDETGFSGQGLLPYRQEAWLFMLSGGALFDHLDYSFTCAAPDGTAPIQGNTPGSGGVEWRSQLAVLKRLLDGLDLDHVSPAPEIVGAPNLPLDVHAASLAIGDAGCLFYLAEPFAGKLAVYLRMPGAYRATWIRPSDGRVVRKDEFSREAAGTWNVVPPGYDEDIACMVEPAASAPRGTPIA